MSAERKSVLAFCCSALFCCSCSRTVAPKRATRSGRCVPSYFFKSPATALCLVDLLFVFAMIWVLYDAAQVMRTRDYDWWWAVPAAFSAPALALVLLKLRYVRRMCDQRWRDDVRWNARIILLPLAGALGNTFLVACWLLCMPFYVVQVTASQPERYTMLFTFERFETALRVASFDLLLEPSSLAFMATYLLSAVMAIVISAKHRRVLLVFVRDAMEQGMDVEGGARGDRSLLSRAELSAATSKEDEYDRSGAAADASRPMLMGTMDSLYSAPLTAERIVYVPPADLDKATRRASYVTPQPIGVVPERQYGMQDDSSEEVQNVRTTSSIYFGPTNGEATLDRNMATIAKQAVQIAARKDTLDRFDRAKEQARAAEAVAAVVNGKSRSPLASPRGGRRQSPGANAQPIVQQQQQPPPPTINPPPPSQGADDESEHQVDSPRFIKRLANNDRAHRRSSRSPSRSSKHD